jgi:hypothetical protein
MAARQALDAARSRETPIKRTTTEECALIKANCQVQAQRGGQPIAWVAHDTRRASNFLPRRFGVVETCAYSSGIRGMSV